MLIEKLSPSSNRLGHQVFILKMWGSSPPGDEIIYGVIAQLVEQRTENPCVLGSIPSDPTIWCGIPLKTGIGL